MILKENKSSIIDFWGWLKIPQTLCTLTHSIRSKGLTLVSPSGLIKWIKLALFLSVPLRQIPFPILSISHVPALGDPAPGELQVVPRDWMPHLKGQNFSDDGTDNQSFVYHLQSIWMHCPIHCQSSINYLYGSSYVVYRECTTMPIVLGLFEVHIQLHWAESGFFPWLKTWDDQWMNHECDKAPTMQLISRSTPFCNEWIMVEWNWLIWWEGTVLVLPSIICWSGVELQSPSDRYIEH